MAMSGLRFRPQLRRAWVACALLAPCGPAMAAPPPTSAAPAAATAPAPSAPATDGAGRPLFAHENVSDLRGLRNALEAFAIACLDQPVTRDLPARLLPPDYRIVGLGEHLLGPGTPDRSDSAILSRTGSEEEDWAGGHPYVAFTMPSQARPHGGCRVAWKRAWDYPEPLDGLMLDMAVRLEARISYRLAAILRSPPEHMPVTPSNSYATVSDWAAACWDGNVCGFSVLLFVSREDGIEIRLEREAVVGGGGGR